MNKLFFVCVLLTFTFSYSQSNTEIFLFDLSLKNGKLELSNHKNISDNEGYDNQPYFLDNNTILYAGTRKGQTDIVKYNISYDSKVFINHTEGSEYSPTKIPGQKSVSSIRLEKNGDQKLYKYNLRNGESEVLIEDIVIGYHAWFNDHILVSSVLEDDKLALYTTNIETHKNSKFHSNIGRSLHKIPNTNLISFISKNDEALWEIQSLDPISGNIKSVVGTLPKSEDMCWLSNGTIVMGHESSLYTFTPKKDVDWLEATSLEALGIKNITRLAISPDGTKMAVVGEANTSEIKNEPQTSTSNINNAGEIVQKHIGPYNEGNLDDFANAFSEDVVVSVFPDELVYKGRETLKQNYKISFEKNNNLTVFVNQRMVLNSYVIDEEIYTYNYTTGRQATVYTTSNKGIDSMTFIENTKTTSNPEHIVDKQLEAYNRKDLDVFMSTYTDDIKLYNFPKQLRTEGQGKMRASYKSWFDNTPDLKATIKQRIIIGNKVIDKEEVRANGKIFNAIAIYEVQNGLISKVTFIQ